MKIIFSPEYAGIVYIRPADDKGVLMDTVVLNTIGLLHFLELRLGFHYEEVPESERVALYYDAVCSYMAEHPSNVMAASFRTAGLSTAQAMLAWREELRGAGWQFEGKDISGRLAALIGVETYFRQQEDCDLAERLRRVVDLLGRQRLDCKDLVVETAVDLIWLKPATRRLLEELALQGVRVITVQGAESDVHNLSRVRELVLSKRQDTIQLDSGDDSFQVWMFADERQACEYLSFCELSEVDVWINADNKQLDNWLKRMGRPLTGSVTAPCIPQLTQLFVLGIGLFARPLPVHTLIEWLNMPVHPLGSYFRSLLADCIVQEGGYRNPACRELVAAYVKGKYVYLTEAQQALPEAEQEELRLCDRPKREKQVSVFLPPLDAPDEIATADVVSFVQELATWARQRAHLMAEDADNRPWVEQLMAVAGLCEAFQLLLRTVPAATVDEQTLDSWMSTIYQKSAYSHAFAEKGCRTVVDSPAKLASVADTTVWIGVEGDAGQAHDCAFLEPTERELLVDRKYLWPWAEDAETNYREQLMLTPLRMTAQRLILVVRETVGGEAAQKHPLLVRLEQQVENLPDFIRRPAIKAKHRVPVDRVVREAIGPELHFQHAYRLQWPDHLSPTNIGTLAEYPFDYVLERLLDLTNDGKAQMADVKTVKGNVAHAVIEQLFAPRHGAHSSSPEDIETRIRHEYEETYARTLEAKGALLLLDENRLTEKPFQKQLRHCLQTLLEILRENELRVTGCEQYVEDWMDLGLPTTREKDGLKKQRDMIGFIDMTLEDKDRHPVVFDFKWTTWAKGYQTKLAENRSVQLEFYRWMLGSMQKDCVEKVAYFLMPEGRLYSRESFKGPHCVRVGTDSAANLVDQLCRSARYRMEQIRNGVLETNGALSEFQYARDTEARGLFPLKVNEEGEKETNFFTQYGLFNR